MFKIWSLLYKWNMHTLTPETAAAALSVQTIIGCYVQWDHCNDAYFCHPTCTKKLISELASEIHLFLFAHPNIAAKCGST